MGKREPILKIENFFSSTKQNACVSGSRKSWVIKTEIRDDTIYCVYCKQNKDDIKL